MTFLPDKIVSPSWERINKTEKRLVAVELTDAELIEKGNKQSGMIQQIAEIEEQIAAFGSRMRARIKTLSADVRDLAQMITSGEEMREMVCDQYYDPRAGMAHSAIDDAVVFSRKMSAEEFQRLIDFETEQGERAGNLDTVGVALDKIADDINNGKTPEGKALKDMGVSVDVKRTLTIPAE